MLSQAHRFHGYGSLKGVYQRGHGVRGSLVSLKYGDRGPGKPYRVAVVVSRKVHKSAVVRNRIRRRLYAIVRRNAGFITPGTDLVITVFSDQVATLDAAKLEAMITDLLSKTTAPVRDIVK